MPTTPRSFQVVIDCGDPDRVAEFWAGALGYRIEAPGAGLDPGRTAAVIDPEGRKPRLFFERVPEGKVVKNRIHLDLNVSGGPNTPAEERRRRIDEEVVRVSGLGATVLRPMEAWGEYWVVMQDPEGNEFCVQ